MCSQGFVKGEECLVVWCWFRVFLLRVWSGVFIVWSEVKGGV